MPEQNAHIAQVHSKIQRELVKFIFAMNNFLKLRFMAMFNLSRHTFFSLVSATRLFSTSFYILTNGKPMFYVNIAYLLCVYTESRNASNDIKLNE